MGQLSSCIFEWDAGAVRRLLAVEQGLVDLMNGEVSGRVSRREMGRHPVSVYSCTPRPAG